MKPARSLHAAGWIAAVVATAGAPAWAAPDDARPAAPASVCKAPTRLAALELHLDAAEAAFAALDPDGFQQSVDEAMDAHRCLEEAVTPTVAARLHWTNGIWLHIRDQKGAAAFSLAAARGLEATWSLSPSVLPKGHEIRVLYAQQSPEPKLSAQPPPVEGELLFDGRPTNQRPVDRATVVQHRHPDRGVLVTDYLMPGEGMPSYGADVASPGLGSAGASGGSARTRARLVNPWLAAGAGLAATGAVATWAIARQAESRFQKDDATYTTDDLDGFQARANGAGAASMGLGVTAGALGVGAFFLGVW